MDFLKAIERLLADTAFQTWKEEHPDSYLVHCVYFQEPNAPWLIGFYHPDRDTLSVFSVGEEIVCAPEEEAFKEEKTILPLDVSRVKTSFTQALDVVEKRLVDMHEGATKRIFILQHLQLGTVWNITYVTTGLKTLNLKIDAQTCVVLQEHIQSLMDFVRKTK